MPGRWVVVKGGGVIHGFFLIYVFVTAACVLAFYL